MPHTIDHQDVTITVEKNYNGDIQPGESINVYLFTASGSTMSQVQAADSLGQVTFNLPAQGRFFTFDTWPLKQDIIDLRQ